MTENDAVEAEQDADQDPDVPFEFDDLSQGRVNDLATNVTLESPQGELTLEDVMLQLIVGHKELEDYKRSAMVLYQTLDERQHVAESNGDTDLVTMLDRMKKSAYGLHLRVERGDAELLGERDGEYSGYFADDAAESDPE